MNRRVITAGATLVSAVVLATVLPTGPASARTLGEDREQTGPFGMYAPPGGGWGAESNSDTGILGSPGYQIFYSWSVQPGSNSTACVDGWVPRGPRGKGEWISMGCGKKGGGQGVLWGNYAAVPKMRAKAGATFTGAIIQWFH